MNCQYCGLECKNIYSLKAHEFRCKLNPNHNENSKKYERSMKLLYEASLSRPRKTFEYISKCEKCGSEFSQLTTQHQIDNKKCKRFCSRVCANSHIRTEESKAKTSYTLNKIHEARGTSRKSDNPEHRKNCSLKTIDSLSNRNKEIKQHNCKFCGKEIFAKYIHDVYCYECAEKNNLRNLQLYNSEGKRIPSKKRIESSRAVQQRLIAEGKHKGWQSRNLVSYPEQFWKEVLENNNIEYSFNHVVKKKELGLNDMSNYFLDFLIDNRIDLEIDGKQHKYPDRIERDKLRDSLLTKAGYIVYRIPWNEIKSEQGQNKMKEKIQSFLNFYKQHKNNI